MIKFHKDKTRWFDSDRWLIQVGKWSFQAIRHNNKPADPVKPSSEPYVGDAYCVNCKVKVDFEGWVRVSDSGRRMAHGNCPRCNTRVFRVLGKA